jgi:alpha-tubulin suppressor-like RCC1 family protein
MRAQLPRQCALCSDSLLPGVTGMVRLFFLIGMVASTTSAGAQAASVFDASAWPVDSSARIRRSDPPRFVEITSGAAHACALSDDGDVWCWGANNLGQAGQGVVSAVVRAPTRIASTRSYVAVAAGAMHTCAISTDKTLDCWGFDPSGELGRGDGQMNCGVGRCNPMPGPVASMRRFESVVAGHQHTCAISGGEAWCWGNNSRGQLGVENAGDRCDGSACARVPRRVQALRTVVAMTAGGAHSCAAVADGSTWCWGDNRSGQLGIGQPQLELSARPVRVASDYRFAALVSGAMHTCGLTSTGAVACWGDNDAGQLGAGFTNRSDVPLRESMRLSWRRVSAAARTTCGITDAGEARCWGFGGGDRLGTIPPDSCVAGPCARLATPVPGVAQATRAAVGGTFACALLQHHWGQTRTQSFERTHGSTDATADVVRCWGGVDTRLGALEDQRATPQLE